MIARSKKLLVYLIFIHCVMFVTLLSLLVVTWCLLIATTVLIVNFIFYAQKFQWLKAKKSLVNVEYNDHIGWLLTYSDESQKTGLSLKGSFVTPQLVILYFNRRHFWQSDVATIVDDAVDAELFRQLRVYLRSPKTFQQ